MWLVGVVRVKAATTANRGAGRALANPSSSLHSVPRWTASSSGLSISHFTVLHAAFVSRHVYRIPVGAEPLGDQAHPPGSRPYPPPDLRSPRPSCSGMAGTYWRLYLFFRLLHGEIFGPTGSPDHHRTPLTTENIARGNEDPALQTDTAPPQNKAVREGNSERRTQEKAPACLYHSCRACGWSGDLSCLGVENCRCIRRP